MSRIVVTGSRGFIAKHTIPLLDAAGHEVVGYDLVDGQDICDKDSMLKILTPGCKVLHLAAVARFAAADEKPSEAYRTNVGGVATLMGAAQEVGVERVVLASTGSVYMPVWRVPLTETHPISGNSHYGLSKAMGEYMAGLYRVPYTVLRYAHVYGKDKWHGGLVDSFIDRIHRGLKPIIYGGYQSNDFVYVKDIAKANLLALETEHVGEAFNIGTGQEVTTDEAVLVLSNQFGYHGDLERRILRVVDAPRFVYDISKAERLLGYNPEWEFKQGIEDMFK